jgi:hypothetical protein
MVSTADTISSAQGIATWIKDILLVVANFLSKYIPFESDNIYIFLIILLSLWISSKFIKFLPTIRSSAFWWFIIAAGIYFILKFLGL